MSERWRCFVAVPLGDDLRSRLAGAIEAWRGDARTDGLRWVEPEALHMTVAFLGDVDPERIPDLERSMGTVAKRHRRAILPTGRLGAFARPSSARVLWYGVGDSGRSVSALASDLGAALGLEAGGEPFRPHVTLARARRRWLDLRGWIEEASASAPEGRVDLDALVFMRSHLGSGPARYETLASVRLGSDGDE